MTRTGMDPHLTTFRPPTAAEQLDGLALFAPPPAPPTPALRRAADTSIDAGRRAQETAPTKRAVVRQVIAAAGAHGVTRKEIAGMTGFLRDTVNGRCREILDDEAEAVVERGRREGEAVIVEWKYAGGVR